MKKFFIQFILLIIVIAVVLYFFRPGGGFGPLLPFVPQAITPGSIYINGTEIKVEVANTQEARSKGLGDREYLASGSGMLFVFDKPDRYSFWMKGVKFPLDLIFIKDNKVADIIMNVPNPKAGEKDENLPIYLPKTEIDKVLEVPAGTARILNIYEGDIVKQNQ